MALGYANGHQKAVEFLSRKMHVLGEILCSSKWLCSMQGYLKLILWIGTISLWV